MGIQSSLSPTSTSRSSTLPLRRRSARSTTCVQAVRYARTQLTNLLLQAIYKNAKSKFLGYQHEGTVLKNVTAIFSSAFPPPSPSCRTADVLCDPVLMRLRQAVLHPELVLKRLAHNLEEKKKTKGRSRADLDGDLDEESIKKLIGNYGKRGEESGAYQSQVLQDLLASQDADEEEAAECVICMEVRVSREAFVESS